MTIKNHLLIAFAISAGVAFGVFMFAPVSKTLYVNNDNSFLAAANTIQAANQDKIGDLSKNIVPSVNAPKNITKKFAETVANELISSNNSPQAAPLPDGRQALNAPDPSAIIEEFINSGIKQANENILNIKRPDLKISYDNGNTAIENYLTETQKIINDNLKIGVSLFSILDEITKNNSGGIEKLLPIISGHEAAANQMERITVPSNLRNLAMEEIKLLRITANVLRAMANIEKDPLGAVAATKQFEAVLQSWVELQNKFNEFIKNFNTKK